MFMLGQRVRKHSMIISVIFPNVFFLYYRPTAIRIPCANFFSVIQSVHNVFTLCLCIACTDA